MPSCTELRGRERDPAGRGLPGRVRMLDKAVTTARAAAQQLGCPVGAIANSLIFETSIAASVGMREQLKELLLGRRRC